MERRGLAPNLLRLFLSNRLHRRWIIFREEDPSVAYGQEAGMSW